MADGHKPPQSVTSNKGTDSASDKIPFPSDQGTTQAFADGGDIRFYEPIPEYEGYHRYDPKETWTPAEEKRLVRKVGFSVYPVYIHFVISRRAL